MAEKQNKSHKRDTIKEQLAELSELKKRYRVNNVRFFVREGAKVSTEDSLCYVIRAIKEAADCSSRKDELYHVGYCPPDQ